MKSADSKFSFSKYVKRYFKVENRANIWYLAYYASIDDEDDIEKCIQVTRNI